MNDKKLAVLIDITQIGHRHISNILNQACQFGEPVIIRAYGVWTAENIIPWHKAAQEYGIELIDNSIATDKDTTVLTLTIDALESYYNQVDGFILCIHHSKYIPLIEFLNKKQVFHQVVCAENNMEALSAAAKNIKNIETDLDDKPIVDCNLLLQAVEQSADVLGWADIEKIIKVLRLSIPYIRQKQVVISYQSCADFEVYQTKRNVWIRKQHSPKSIVYDINAIIHILQCIKLLIKMGEILWLENIATLLHYYQQVLPQNYACESYLDLLLELPFLTKRISDGKIIFEYKKSANYQKTFSELFLAGQTVQVLEIVDLNMLPKISGLRTLDGIYGKWLREFVQQFIIPSTQRASYDILYRALIEYPDIDSADFGHERWLGMFEQSEQFTVIQENQYWIMLKN